MEMSHRVKFALCIVLLLVCKVCSLCFNIADVCSTRRIRIDAMYRRLTSHRPITTVALYASKYDGMTVVDLKKILKDRNLPVSGVKNVLIDRLQQSEGAASAAPTAIGNMSSGKVSSRSGAVKSIKNDNIVSTKFESLDDLLDFDDSIFDKPVGKNERDDENDEDDDDSDSNNSRGGSGRIPLQNDIPPYRRGDTIMAKVLSYGPLGASIKVIDNDRPSALYTGLILRSELSYWIELHKYEPALGEVIPAYVQNIREGGKIDVSLRPVGFDKVVEAKDKLLELLMDPANNGKVALGDKSLPEDIWKILPGMSKNQLKGGIGALIRDGAIVVTAFEMTIVPENKRVPLQAEPYNGKAPRGWRAPDDSTVFIGNLAYSSTTMSLARALEDEIGYGKIASIKIATDPDTGRSRGYAHVDFFNADVAKEALKNLPGALCDGRELRIESKSRVRDRDPVTAPRDWGDSSSRGIAGNDRVPLKDLNDNADDDSSNRRSREGSIEKADGSWSVFIGGLPYMMSVDTLRYTIETSLKGGSGSIVDVRISTDKETGRSRGFGFIDFVDQATAERAVTELSGMTIMGRPVRLDVEGPKARGMVDRSADRSDRGGGRTGGRDDRVGGRDDRVGGRGGGGGRGSGRGGYSSRGGGGSSGGYNSRSGGSGRGGYSGRDGGRDSGRGGYSSRDSGGRDGESTGSAFGKRYSSE